jgi:hypothetical protein
MYTKTIVMIGAIVALTLGAASAVAAPKAVQTQPRQLQSNELVCIQVSNTTWSQCKDAGNYDSSCATAQCPSGYKLTGGGGTCAAGDRKLKGLNPKLSTGEFGIMCEKQGVKPQVSAICCKA